MNGLIMVCIGTRPEMIKMAPVIDALRMKGRQVLVVFTGQHRELLDDAAQTFGIEADVDLQVMAPGQSLVECQQKLMIGLHEVIAEHKPQWVMAQGDTMSVYCSAMAAFLNKVPFAHVEAGLRSCELFDPFPEEGLRRAISALTTMHFAPTSVAQSNLLREGHVASKVWVVGNTCIDALLSTVKSRPLALPRGLAPDMPMILVTVHRRENQGEVLDGIIDGVIELAARYPDHQLVWPVHPNPNVRRRVYSRLSEVANVHLCDPLNYGAFVSCLACARVVLTDSGGVQEEAPALGVPVMVVRKTTERPEGVLAGAARLIGVEAQAIVESVSAVLDNDVLYKQMAGVANPYGDGDAAQRIADVLVYGQCEPFDIQGRLPQERQSWL